MKKKQIYLCADIIAEMNDRNMQPGEKRVVEAVMDASDEQGIPYADGEHFTLREIVHPVHQEHPELRWHLIDRSKHGRVSINSRHVKVEFYIHHDEYGDGRDLADILASEVETLGDNLCETDLQEEVEKCLC